MFDMPWVQPRVWLGGMVWSENHHLPSRKRLPAWLEITKSLGFPI